jgi:glucose/arabinose dehydrogenase
MQYDADGKNGRVYAKGLRNAVGIAVNPNTHALWVVVNERDDLPPNHENLPPEEVNILRDGGDYGWPYCYGNRISNPEYHDAARCANTIPPALEMQAHSAPLGMTFLQNATQLPESERGDMLVAFHGSWNRSTPTGAKVVRVSIVNNQPTAVQDFITGWQRSDGSRWGRPVDVAVMKDGSILISDDASGEIIHLTKRP